MRTDEAAVPSVGTVNSLVREGVHHGVDLSVRYGRGRWWNIVIVVTTLILYSIAWPTLQLTHDVPAPLMPIVLIARLTRRRVRISSRSWLS